MDINANTTAMELAALVSQALEAAGITATLSGGGAVSIYTHNQYQSNDLDFVTLERRDRLSAALAPYGFTLASDRRHFTHPDTTFFLEFPAAPLEFGSRGYRKFNRPFLRVWRVGSGRASAALGTDRAQIGGSCVGFRHRGAAQRLSA